MRLRRMIPRFSLRTLVVFLLFVAAMSAWWAHRSPWALEKEMRGHTGAITCCRFSEDGSHLLTGSWDKTARLWLVAEGKEVLVLEGHADAVVEVSFSRDGGRALTVGREGTARVWDLGTGEPIASIEDDAERVKSAALSPDGRLAVVLIGDQCKATIWQTDPKKELARLESNEPMSIVAALNEPDRVVTWDGAKTGRARTWDARTGEVIDLRWGHEAHEKVKEHSRKRGPPVVITRDPMWAKLAGLSYCALAERSPDGQRHVRLGDVTVRLWRWRGQPKLEGCFALGLFVFLVLSVHSDRKALRKEAA